VVFLFFHSSNDAVSQIEELLALNIAIEKHNHENNDNLTKIKIAAMAVPNSRDGFGGTPNNPTIKNISELRAKLRAKLRSELRSEFDSEIYNATSILYYDGAKESGKANERRALEFHCKILGEQRQCHFVLDDVSINHQTATSERYNSFQIGNAEDQYGNKTITPLQALQQIQTKLRAQRVAALESGALAEHFRLQVSPQMNSAF